MNKKQLAEKIKGWADNLPRLSYADEPALRLDITRIKQLLINAYLRAGEPEEYAGQYEGLQALAKRTNENGLTFDDLDEYDEPDETLDGVSLRALNEIAFELDSVDVEYCKRILDGLLSSKHDYEVVDLWNRLCYDGNSYEEIITPMYELDSVLGEPPKTWAGIFERIEDTFDRRASWFTTDCDGKLESIDDLREYIDTDELADWVVHDLQGIHVDGLGEWGEK